jgi:hypothetical protein
MEELTGAEKDVRLGVDGREQAHQQPVSCAIHHTLIHHEDALWDIVETKDGRD